MSTRMELDFFSERFSAGVSTTRESTPAERETEGRATLTPERNKLPTEPRGRGGGRYSTYCYHNGSVSVSEASLCYHRDSTAIPSDSFRGGL